MHAAGSIAQVGGTIAADTLTGSASSAVLNNPANRISNLGSFTAGGLGQVGTFILMDAGLLNITGPVFAANLNLTVGGPLQIGTAAAPATLNAGAVALTAVGPITEPNGSIVADSLFTRTTAGDILLTSVNNKVAASTGLTAGNGDVVFVDDPALVLTGTFSGNNLFFEVAASGDTLVLGTPRAVGAAAPIGGPAILTSAPGGRVSLVADNYIVGNPTTSVTANAGTVELSPFSAIQSSLLGSSGQNINSDLLSIIHTGSGTLAVGGFTDVPAGSTAPATRANSITLDAAANLNPIAATLRLDSTGPILQTAGGLTVGNLTGSAGTSANITQPANLIGNLGAFNTGAGFALTNAQTLTVTGPVRDSGATSAVGLNARAGDLDIAGSVTAANAVNLTAAGAINETGTLVAAALSGSAAFAATLTGPNRVGVLGNFSSAELALNNTIDLAISGTLNAANIVINVPGHQISLSSGATVITQNALLQSADFAQIGSSAVLGQGGSGSTLRIAGTGTQQFDPALGLQATGTSLTLDLSTGFATGNVFVGALDVTYTAPGGTNLSGTIAGITGGPAAAAGNIQPAVNANYLFNGCIIAAPVCQPSPPPPPPPPRRRLTDSEITSALGGIYPFLPGSPPDLVALPHLVLVAIPLLRSQPPQLTDTDVVPPNITYLDY